RPSFAIVRLHLQYSLHRGKALGPNRHVPHRRIGRVGHHLFGRNRHHHVFGHRNLDDHQIRHHNHFVVHDTHHHRDHGHSHEIRNQQCVVGTPFLVCPGTHHEHCCGLHIASS